MPHIHLGIIDGVKVFAWVILFGTLWRLVAGYFHDTSIGQGMAFIY